MLGFESTPLIRPGSPRPNIVGIWNRLLTPDDFRLALEKEVMRHHRHLTGFGLLRIGPREHFEESDALKEAFETETRRSDSAAAMPDGTCVLLALHARMEHLHIIATRLREAALAIHEEYDEEPITYVTGMVVATERRKDADELWVELNRSFEKAKTALTTETARLCAE